MKVIIVFLRPAGHDLELRSNSQNATNKFAEIFALVGVAVLYPNEADESVRIKHLQQLGILDSPQDMLFQALVKQALVLAPSAAIAAISLVDTDRQWFKAICGLAAQETPRSVSFCSHTIQTAGVMVVPDATRDRRFADNPLVTSNSGIRSYLGVKLVNGVGALCAIGLRPRQPTLSEIEGLVKLSKFVDIQLLAFGTLYNLENKMARSTSAMLDDQLFRAPPGISRVAQ